MKKIFILTFNIIIIISLKAQDFGTIKMFPLEPITLNTAWGYKYDAFSLSLIAHKQWNKPNSVDENLINLAMPLATNMGGNINIYSYNYAFVKNFGFSLGYFYHLRLNNMGTKLSFSVDPVFRFYSIDQNWFNYRDNFDPTLQNFSGTKFSFNFNTGIHLQHNNLNTGISVKNLIPQKIIVSEFLSYNEKPVIYTYLNYNLSNFKKTFYLNPTLLFAYDFNGNPLMYLEGDFIYKNFLLFGLGYYETFQVDRFSTRSLNFLFKILIKQHFVIGMSYEDYFGSLGKVFGNGIGFVLGYKFGKQEKTVPSYF